MSNVLLTTTAGDTNWNPKGNSSMTPFIPYSNGLGSGMISLGAGLSDFKFTVENTNSDPQVVVINKFWLTEELGKIIALRKADFIKVVEQKTAELKNFAEKLAENPQDVDALAFIKCYSAPLNNFAQLEKDAYFLSSLAEPVLQIQMTGVNRLYQIYKFVLENGVTNESTN